MTDTTLLETLIAYFREKGYIINNHMDILKIKYDCNDIEILKKYLDEFQTIQNKKFIVRCLSKKYIKNVAPYLVDLFKSSDNNDYRWVIANSLFAIGDKTLLDSYIEIVKNKKYRTSRQMIVLLLGKIKELDSKNTLISLLNNYDYDVLSQTISALNSMIDNEIYVKMKVFVTNDNIEKMKRDLIFLKENDTTYNLVDIEGFIKLILKEANKVISNYEK